MKNTKNNIFAIIFFGGIWGIVEASLGYVLHIIPGLSLYVSGAVLFSFAGFILYKAYAVTSSRTSLLAIGGIAALIKAVDFFLPFTNPYKIINPMLSIIMESLMLIVVISLLNKDNLTSKVSAFVIASIGWRVLYFAYMGIQYLTTGFVYLPTYVQYIEFFGIYALASAALGLVIIYFDHYVLSKIRHSRISVYNPVFSAVSIILAVVLTILL